MPNEAADSQAPKLIYVSPDSLAFDPDNPRFAATFAGKNQDQIQQAIFGEPHFASELVDSFLANGFIDYEPLVVKTQGDKFVVIEGNRRLAAVKHILANQDKYQGRIEDLKSIPVLVFPDQPDEQQRNEMRVYLGVRHLLGFREWPPLSKANFLDRESKQPGGLDRVIKEVRLTKQQVRRFLVPYRLLNTAKLDLPPEEDFWMIGEALSRTGVKGFLQLDVSTDTLEIRSFNKANLKLLLDDLYGAKLANGHRRDAASRKVQDTRDLSTYAKILTSDKATKALHIGKSLHEAAIYVDTRDESLKRLTSLVKEIKLLLERLAGTDKTPSAKQLPAEFKSFEAAVKQFLKTNG